ncbi:MAG TPA: hypothetical protein VNG13_15590 [Mycobacteriales bacterium]|nr:hypothetical protein [Mycobacteriales bacterium]
MRWPWSRSRRAARARGGRHRALPPGAVVAGWSSLDGSVSPPGRLVAGVSGDVRLVFTDGSELVLDGGSSPAQAFREVARAMTERPR